MKSERKIAVQYEYDADYRHLLWKAFKEDYVGSDCGQKPFYYREMRPRIDPMIKNIEMENAPDDKYEFRYPDLYAGYKLISDYVREGGIEEDVNQTTNKKPRNFSAEKIRLFDAYMKIKHPVIATTFSPSRDTDATGFVFGEFLTDVAVRKRLYEMEVTLQSLIGIYEYQEETTGAARTGINRYLALFRGDTEGYLLVMDFSWSLSDKVVHLVDEHLRLYYGFCIPGRNFSPIILRSLDQRERQVGMMYGKDALVDFSAPTLEQVFLQTYTTDIDHFPDKPGDDQSSKTKLFQEVLRLKEGPVLNRTMFRVKNSNEYNAIAKRIRKIKRDRL